MQKLAEVARRTHEVLEIGIMPDDGLNGEKLDPKSNRGKLAGQSVCGSWIGIFAGTKSDGKARVP